MLVITLGPGNIDLSIPSTIALGSALSMLVMNGSNRAITLGLLAAAGLDVWWRVGVIVPAVGFAGLFAYLTLTKRRVDTWDAIWGPYGR